MTEVESSYIHMVEYVEVSNTLLVEFIKGKNKKWRYTPVTQDGFNAMMNSDSVGAYFAQHIRNNPDIQAESYE